MDKLHTMGDILRENISQLNEDDESSNENVEEDSQDICYGKNGCE